MTEATNGAKAAIIKVTLIHGSTYRFDDCDAREGTDTFVFIRQGESGKIIDVIPKSNIEHIRLYYGEGIDT